MSEAICLMIAAHPLPVVPLNYFVEQLTSSARLLTMFPVVLRQVISRALYSAQHLIAEARVVRTRRGSGKPTDLKDVHRAIILTDGSMLPTMLLSPAWHWEPLRILICNCAVFSIRPQAVTVYSHWLIN